MPISNQIPSSRLIQPGVVDSAATRPASPFEGQCIFQKDTDQLLVWNGTAWVIPNSPAQNPTGLELVTTQTIGSGVTTVTVLNCFNSTYDNYRVILNSTGSANGSVGIRIGASQTEYYGYLFYGDWTSITPQSQNSNNLGLHRYIGGCFGAGQSLHASCDILSPFKSEYTRFGNGTYLDTTSIGTSQGVHKVVSSYSSCDLIFQGGGTMTGGTISVYGYRK